MEQEGLGDEARLIFITHTAREADVQATLHDLRDLDVVDRDRHACCGSSAMPSRDEYVSTRGARPTLGFADVLLDGLARDGGLYVPDAAADSSLPGDAAAIGVRRRR